MKKKILALICLVTLGISAFAGCKNALKTGEENEGEKMPVADAFVPTKTVDWVCTSSPGGGSDIFSRQISDIMISEDMVNGQSIVVSNKTDGSGEVGRNEVATMKGDKANYTLLTFNSGDLMPMVENTKNRSENFRILAVMAVDKQLLFKGKQTKFEDFKAAIEAASDGEQVIIGGSKGDDIATYEKLIAELGFSKDVMNYITYDSTGDAITAQLGGHIDFVMSKPAAASEYVESGDLTPVLALAVERFTGNLSDAPTLSEIGDYENVEVPVWRGVAAPAAMSDEAVEFWTEALFKVSETDTWKTDYIEKNKLIPNYMNHGTATEYVTQYEKEYMEANGITK
jgi:putative tricarboxylic transport membrane protein